MRIKIIGDNNCARATRHLLRQAGFAVTEFLAADVATQAPHSGYVIAIDLAPAPHPPHATPKPDHPTHGQPASTIGEASSSHGGASSPTSTDGLTLGRIHFDSVDGELEAAILRHVTQLASAPVVVDRPGGVVHSERELRIVVPHTGDAKADEAARIAVEFGVLRGLLDLASPPPPSLPKPREATPDKSAFAKVSSWLSREGADKSAVAPRISWSGGGRKWWRFGLVLISGAALTLAGDVHASLRHDAIGSEHVIESRRAGGMYLGSTAINDIFVSRCKYSLDFSLVDCPSYVRTNAYSQAFNSTGCKYSPCPSAVINDSIAELTSGNPGALRATSDRMFDLNLGKLGGAALSGAHVVHRGDTAFRVDCAPRCVASHIADRAFYLPAAAFAAQGQFATGQAPVKITDGTNTLVVDPCKAQTKLYVSINQTGNTQLVAGTASKKIYICSIHMVVAVVTNVALVEGTGSVCATGTAGVSGFGGATAASGWNFAANGGIALGNGDAAVGAEGTNADNLCLFNSGSGQVSGGISYVVQ